MRFYITFILLLTLGYSAQAQGEAQISIGKRGNKYTATQLITEKMSASLLKEDAKLYVTEAGNEQGDTYLIPNYEVSVESADGTITGPFAVKENNEQEVFDKLYTHLEAGAKVTYNKIMIVCRTCTPPAPINARGVVVTVE